MENSALRYKIYRVLLESDLTSKQREVVLEGWFDNLKDWLGAAKDTGKTDVGKIFADNKYNRRVKTVANNITKEIEGLKAVAKDAGVPEEVALELLNSILKGAGADPAKIETAADSPSTSGGEGSTGGSGGSSGGGGVTTVTADTLTSNPAAAAALSAAVSGRSAADAAAAAEQKKTNPKDMVKDWISGIAKGSGVDEAKTKKIVKALLDGEHIKIDLSSLAESLRRIKKVLAERKSFVTRRDPILERWQKLAGLSQLNEGPATDDIVDGLKSKKIKNDDDLRSAIKGYKGDDLKDLESNKDQVVGAVRGNPAFPGFDKKLEDMLQDLKKSDSKKAEDTPAAAPEGSSSGGEPAGGGSESGGAAAEDDSKEYENVFKDVRAKITDENIKDDEIKKVIKFIDLKDAKDAPVSIA